jgi:ribosomal-protein-alanine N-acetyltransferase
MLEVNFDPFPIIETERLLLRRMTMDDAHDFFSLRSNVNAMKHICKPLQTSIEEAREKISQIDEMIDSNSGIGWGIMFKDQTTIIGNLSFHKIEKTHYRAEIGYILHPDYWRQGIVNEAVKAIIDFGFNELKFHSIEAHIDPTNIGSEKILKKNNFINEAYFKENYFYNGQFLDTAVYSLVNSIK